MKTVNNNDASSDTCKSRLENFQIRHPKSEIFSPETPVVLQNQEVPKNNTNSEISENKTRFSQNITCTQIFHVSRIFASIDLMKLNFLHTPTPHVLKSLSSTELSICRVGGLFLILI